ncbi:MAG: sialate O-acetylesterase [Clostridiales bacterium]|jgi:hypothetical protein|nr:sialate O-acetylesterase [Clostridiales bacterium]
MIRSEIKNFMDVPCDVVVLAGQSNAYGCGLGGEPYKPRGGVWLLRADFRTDATDGRVSVFFRNNDFFLEEAAEYGPEGHWPDGGKENILWGNFGFRFAEEYCKNGDLAEGRRLLIVRAAVGSTSFAQKHWGINDVLYSKTAEMTRAALGFNAGNRLAAVLWHQGESDACDADMTYATHYGNLRRLVETFRREFGQIPFIAADFVHDWKNASWYPGNGRADAVVRAVRDVCARVGGAAFVETEGLQSNFEAVGADDHVHFSREALNALGARYYGAYKTLARRNEKWYWTDLVGFDGDGKAGYGVPEFLRRAGGDVYGVSLLFSDIDFINLHRSADCEYELRPCDCSYGAHPYGAERDRRVWTNRELRGLVKTLRAYGIKVLLSFFNVYTYLGDDGKVKAGAYSKAHPELWDTRADGKRSKYSINVLKRLPDKTYYQDYLAAKLKEAVEYYGFDGAQIADGVSGARLGVQNGDVSDDLFAQFAEASGADVSGVPPVADGDGKLYRERRAWLFENKLYEWLVFLSGRWADFYACLTKSLSGKTVLFNQEWTCDPFEALYRYGIDYQKAYKGGIYAMMIEDVSAGAAILAVEDLGGARLTAADRKYRQNESGLAQMSVKAALPALKQITMTQVKDIQEDWDVIHTAPTEIERTILRRNNNFVFDGKGYVNCSDGPLYCLADGVPAEDWRYLFARENRRADGICGTLGFAAVWPGDSLYAELRDYIRTNDYTSAELRKEFLNAGLPISTAVRCGDAERIAEPLFAARPEFFSAQEREILERVQRPMLVVGRSALKRKADAVARFGDFAAYLYNFGGAAGRFDEKKIKSLEASAKTKACKPGVYADCGGLWTCPLKYNRTAAAFFRRFSREVNLALGLPRVENGRDCTVTVFRIDDTQYRALIGNNEFSYIIPKIVFPFAVKSARSLGKNPQYKIRAEGNAVFVRIPPRGADILILEGEKER